MCGRVDGELPFLSLSAPRTEERGLTWVGIGEPAPLAAHLEEQNVEFIQFAFRWMNCLLMREMSVKNIIRMWDTYLVSLVVFPLLAARPRTWRR